MKYYEILPTHTETPRNATRKIANLYIEFNYHFLTLQKKNPITFEQECTNLDKSIIFLNGGKSIQWFQRSAFRKVWTQFVPNLASFLVHAQVHMRQMGK